MLNNLNVFLILNAQEPRLPVVSVSKTFTLTLLHKCFSDENSEKYGFLVNFAGTIGHSAILSIKIKFLKLTMVHEFLIYSFHFLC